MLLSLLLITRAAGEWVEISQQHYRKPLRAYSVLTTTNRSVVVEHTTRPWGYGNHSISEYNFNRRNYFGNVKLDYSSHKITDRVDNFDRNPFLDIEKLDEQRRVIFGPTKATIEYTEDDNVKGSVERVSNKGNVKRQLSNSPVKSPKINSKSSNSQNLHFNNRYDDEDEIERDDIRETKPVHRKVHFLKSTPRNPFLANDEDIVITDVPVVKQKESKYQINNTSVRVQKPKIVSDLDVDIDNDEVYKSIHKDTNVTGNSQRFPSHSNENNVIKSSFEISSQNKMASTTKKYLEKDQIEDTTFHPITKPELKNKNDKDNSVNNVDRDKISDDDKQLKGSLTKTTRLKGKKPNTMENVMKFVKVVADTITKNTRRSFSGKLRYLQELKDTILANIEDRIEATWSDDETSGGPRRPRSSRAARATAAARGHIEFPSSEGALMTISFLTFAVFLIKLVLQVIQTYKNKAMMVAPMMVAAAGRAGAGAARAMRRIQPPLT